MADRYFIADKPQKLFVDLDTVTLCDQQPEYWALRQQGYQYETFIYDDATGAALFAALCAWRKEHPAHDPQKAWPNSALGYAPDDSMAGKAANNWHTESTGQDSNGSPRTEEEEDAMFAESDRLADKD